LNAVLADSENEYFDEAVLIINYWQSLSWVSPVATDNTAIDFYSICNGTTGWVNWDKIRVT
jgi:hypothetical protein